MKRNISRTGCIVLCTLTYLPIVYAEGNQGYRTESGLTIIPIFDTKLEYNDNIGRYSEEIAPESSYLLDVSPGILLESDRGGNLYSVGYQLSSGTYFDSRDDDYLDHNFYTKNFVRYNIRHGMEFNYQYKRDHQERGTGIFAGDEFSTRALNPVEYQQHNLDLKYIYGADGARGKIEAKAIYTDREYLNYRFLTGTDEPFSTSYKDYSQVGGGLAFYYRRSDTTSLFAEIDANERHYEREFNGRIQDSLNLFYFLGGKWDLTGVTTGTIRLGMQDKDYKDPDSKDFQGFSWNVKLNWKPAEYSSINFSGGQRARDPDQGVNSQYIQSTLLNADWKHYWQYNIFSMLTLASIHDVYSASDREDDKVRASVGVGYRIRKDFEALLRWQYEEKDSNVPNKSYTQNAYGLAATYRF